MSGVEADSLQAVGRDEGKILNLDHHKVAAYRDAEVVGDLGRQFLELDGPISAGFELERFHVDQGNLPVLAVLVLGLEPLARFLHDRFGVREAVNERAGVLPPYDPERAAIYKKHALPLMKIWRSAFGVGSLVFGLAIFNAFGRPDIFLLFRLVFLNAVFFGYLWPAQRRATRAAFEEMGLTTNASREAVAQA